ncbi:hypothetical protein [Halobacteriovorax sp. JY17]|uniref:hypothetical protein n=1 Tax=Halobacteriovorax sp. JY17 TaxID=2014617 RepID=UPI000C4E9C14|nr:hypothetical protein [Halobacteriovorax sp. JY17]PIK14245.1 MAG: hypothetical protein CES88_14810 [Halobacteriovorax sp. JY17]
MSAKNFLLTSVFRVLTPEEISELTSSSNGDSRTSLTDIINQRLDGVSHDFSDAEKLAKILPFKAKKSEEEVAVHSATSCGKKSQEFIERFFERKKIKDTALNEKGEPVETSSFIFKEKERFAYSQSKLKQVEVLSLYRKNAAVDVQQVRAMKDDFTQSAQSGVLINKKHY